MSSLAAIISQTQKIYFIGVGGVGMSALAHIMHARGFTVAGTDLKESRYTELLVSEGCQIEIGHSVSSFEADVVIISSAIQEANTVLQFARSQNLPIFHRSELLGYIMDTSLSFGVTGTHGKTTTSSLLSYFVDSLGLTPTCIVGSTMHNFGTNALFGSENIVIAEVDESDKSLLNVHPTVGIITNIDNDHLDIYADIDEIKETIASYVASIKHDGVVVYNADDAAVCDVVQDAVCRSVSFGIDAAAHVRAQNLVYSHEGTMFDLIVNEREVGTASLPLFGKHNVSNVLAAIAACVAQEYSVEKILAVMPQFSGVKRRLEIHFEDESYRVLDDYAHHPTEIVATLAVLNQIRNDRESICVVFQPHRYSRTMHLMDDLITSFDGIDQLVITDIYAASEAPVAGVSAHALCLRLREEYNFPVTYIPCTELHERLISLLPEKSTIAFLGAGNINEVAHEFSTTLQNNYLRK